MPPAKALSSENPNRSEKHFFPCSPALAPLREIFRICFAFFAYFAVNDPTTNLLLRDLCALCGEIPILNPP